MKKGLIILGIVVVIIIAIVFFATRQKTDNNNVNTTVENKVVEEFVQVLNDGTKLNISGKDTKVMLIDIILLDKNENELGKANGIIGDLKAGAKTQ